MSLTAFICSYCKKKFLRPTGHANETIKLGRKPYCSLRCLGVNYKNRTLFTCGNPQCSNKFERTPSETSPHNFCSHSCAAKVTNAKRGKLVKNCANPSCKNNFTGSRKYCAFGCIPVKKSEYTREIVIGEIRKFTRRHGRIPTKRELNIIYKVARKHFGTWNNAIEASGLKSNPVMFAKKYIANDGHKCDSLAEKIIDDWLYARKIKHERNVPYPSGNGFTADFVVDDYWIEFFGLHGEHKRYDELRREKLKLVKKYRLKLIEVYPKGLFPENLLHETFAVLGKYAIV